MSTTGSSGGPPPNGSATKPSFGQRLKTAIVHADAELSFVKGLGIIGVLGTLIGGYFQYLSAYQEKVVAQAKDDLTAATTAFTDTSSAFSTAISLQDQLFYDLVHGNKLNASNDDNALTSKNARELYKPYQAASDGLRDNINLIARKMELYLDWPSDPDRDPATNTAIGIDPITTSFLGSVDFDCDNDMPSLDPTNHAITRAKNGKSLTIDWYSAKHHVLTIDYCFQVTDKIWMEIVRQWASKSSSEPAAVKNFFSDTESKLKYRLDTEVVRLNAFMSRAMSEIEAIHVKYRPNGFYCHLPGVREVISIFSRKCLPVRLADTTFELLRIN